MKCGLIFLLLIPLCNSFYAQDVNELFFDEASFSFNRTNLADTNTENRNGFGLGVYHSFFAKSLVNLTFGIEYNRTNQFHKYMYEGFYSHLTDLSYNINMISFPVGLRFNMGNNFKVFFEAGGYADLVIKATKKGIMHTYNPHVNDSSAYQDFPIDGKADISSVLGFYTGLGLRIPVSLFELVIKGDYKYGLQNLNSYSDAITNTYWRISIGIKHK
jgi:hypothetical protein